MVLFAMFWPTICEIGFPRLAFGLRRDTMAKAWLAVKTWNNNIFDNI